MPNLTVVRGFVGSGRSTLSRQLAGKSGRVYSLDDHLLPVSGDDDIFTSLEYARACASLHAEVDEALRKTTSDIVIDTIAFRLWEVRDYWEMAQKSGFNTFVQTPATSWARDVEECEKRTKFKLNPHTWETLVQSWEGPATRMNIEAALSPEERLLQAKFVAADVDLVTDPAEKKNKDRFLIFNYPEEVGQLIESGFLAQPMSERRREAFRLDMQALGKKSPAMTPLELRTISIDNLDSKIKARLGRDKPSIER